MVQVMQYQITDRQNRQFSIIVPGNGSDAAIIVNRFLHDPKRILSQLYCIGRINFIREFIV